MEKLIAILRQDEDEMLVHLNNTPRSDWFPSLRVYPSPLGVLREYEIMEVVAMFHISKRSADDADNKILLIRDRSKNARLPRCICEAPYYINSTDVQQGQTSLDEILEWNIANALCNLRDGSVMDSYRFGLTQGPIRLSAMIKNTLGLIISDNIEYTAIYHSRTYDNDKHCTIYCNIDVIDFVPNHYEEHSYVKLSYDIIRKYNRACETGFYEEVYMHTMDKQYRIYSRDDDRIKLCKSIFSAFDMWRRGLIGSDEL